MARANVYFAIFILTILVVKCKSDCHKLYRDGYKLFGKKTVYQVPSENYLKNLTNIPDCKVVQLWILARHGARYPELSEIEKMEHLLDLRDAIVFNHERLKRGNLCKTDVDALKLWTLDADKKMQYQLTAQGRIDHIEFVERLKRRYPDIFPAKLNKSLYEFHHSGRTRAWQTTEMFIRALFPHAVNVTSYATDSPDVVMPYDGCTPWLASLQSKKEMRFPTGPEIMRTVKDVSKRLGFKYQLTTEIIQRAYEMCRYDLAWNVTKMSSPWCSIFSKENLLVYEYLEDLTTYESAGYGMPNATKFGCIPFKNAVERFKIFKQEPYENRQIPKALFHLSHSTMMTMNIASLGILDGDVPLTDFNYLQMANRQWRMSKYLPFSANFIIAFYKCSSGEERNRVMIMLNEKPIQLSINGCSKDGICTWPAFKHFIESKDCDVSWCKTN